jgi:hypothetical protein
MSDKKKNNFFPLFFCSRALKTSEKKFYFFCIEQIVIVLGPARSVNARF